MEDDTLSPEKRGVTKISRTFELERDLELGAVGFDLALGVELQIERDDLGDAQIPQRFSGPVTAAVAAFSQDSLLVPISSITL